MLEYFATLKSRDLNWESRMMLKVPNDLRGKGKRF